MKKPILGLILTHLAQIQTQNFFRKLYLFQKLDIAPRYHPKQFMEKLMSQTEENVKNLIQSPILAQIQAPNFFSELYLYQQLNIFPSYHARQFKGKLLSQTKKNVKNLLLGPILTHLAQIQAQNFFSEALPQLDVRHWCKLSSQAISREIKEPK